MKNLIGTPVVCHQEEFISLENKGLDKESTLDELVVSYPSLLPIEQINKGFADPVLVIPQFGIDGNWVDVLLVNKDGRITIVESKLQKNPEAKRKVFGQILDYATSIHNLDYNTFSAKCAQYANEVKAPLNVEDPLVAMMEELCDDFDASAFREKVISDLELGRFLLIILGDEVHDELAEMVNFLTEHSKLGFEFAAVEFMHFESDGQKQEHKIIVPRVVDVLSRQLVPWEPDRDSASAQQLNKVVKRSTGGGGRTSLSEAEAISAFRTAVIGLENGSQLLGHIDVLSTKCTEIGITAGYRASGASCILYYEPPKWEGRVKYNLLPCTKEGLLHDSWFLQYRCDKDGLPDSIWINHWTRLGEISGAGELIHKPTNRCPNLHKFYDKNGKAPKLIGVFGANGEHIDAIVQLLGETANAIMEDSEALDD